MKGLRGGGDVSSLIRERWVCLFMVTEDTYWLVMIGVRVTTGSNARSDVRCDQAAASESGLEDIYRQPFVK